ncbi:hypothetical protein D3C76_876910 [compost metagenome]
MAVTCPVVASTAAILVSFDVQLNALFAARTGSTVVTGVKLVPIAISFSVNPN